MIQYTTREGEILKTSDRWHVVMGDRVNIKDIQYYVFRTEDKKTYIKAYVVKEGE